MTLSVELDGQLCYRQIQNANAVVVSIPFEDHNSDHRLRLTMSGKLPEHTQLATDHETILSDRVMLIDRFCFDGIDITPHFYRLSRYWHDFNGSSGLSQHEFYGSMGCNGDLVLDFSTPIYPWILENAR